MASNKQTPQHAFVGIDIGNSKVACVIGVQEKGAPALSILGVGKAANTGMRKGQVVDIDDTVQAITTAVDEAERISGYSVDSATISVGGANIISLNSKGVIAVGGMDKEIMLEDVHRVEDAAAVVQLPPNREILQVFPRSYRLDGQDNIKDPVGMSGVRLEVDAHIITGSTPAIKNIERCLAHTGISPHRFIVDVLAASQVVMSKQQRENGTAVIDIGSTTTGVAVFEDGEILHTAIIPIGSTHVTNDLAIGLQTDLETAERIKRELVKLEDNRKQSRTHTIIEHDSKKERQINQKEINHIVEARLKELFSLINKELKKVDRVAKLPGGVILTGGGSKMGGIEIMAKAILMLNAKIGKLDGFSGIFDTANSPDMSVAVGLMYEDMLSSNEMSTAWNVTSSLTKGSSLIKGFLQRFRP